MLSDALTTSALCATLYDAKVHFKPSVKLVRTIIVYAMNRFILTTIIGCVQMIVMIINPHNQAILAADFISAHLYINSFLATLNARNRIRAIGTGGTFVDVSSFSEGPSGAYTFDAARSRTTNVNLPDVSAQEAEEGNLDLSDGRSKSRQRGESAGNLKRVQIEVEVEREEYVLSDMALQHEQDDQKGSAESHVV
ncbi:hypothetical protein VKT23_006187 [Stygiomarasmius scandens]|uniref:DUF6534 domain-containing protein n=1 Tax=Marasmiellus scandens TaxID=2682957 RepID=A0ABR1JPD0_9AGAR